MRGRLRYPSLTIADICGATLVVPAGYVGVGLLIKKSCNRGLWGLRGGAEPGGNWLYLTGANCVVCCKLYNEGLVSG